jgi:DNA-binding MarR family transcriptional regulator
METLTRPGVAEEVSTSVARALAADFERIVGLFRSLSLPSELSMNSATTLASIERFGPQRLTLLAASEDMTQPAMTQLVNRLEEAGLMRREASPDDRRIVLVTITEAGRAMLARRRAVHAERLAGILAELSPAHQQALAVAVPALDALASVPREEKAEALAAGDAD